jgi:hypothetical protein
MSAAMGGKILIVAADYDTSADAMVLCLRRRGAAFERFHPSDFPQDVSLSLRFGGGGRPDGRIWSDTIALDRAEIGSVWFRRSEPYRLPGELSDSEREFAERECGATLFGLWRSLPVLWVSHPDAIRAAESKALQLAMAQDLGARVPRTLFTNDPSDLARFFEETGGRLVHKVMTQGVLGRDERQMVYTSRLLREHLARADLLKSCPGLFQQLIEKACDLRITVIGEQVFAVEIHSQADERGAIDWRRGDVPKLKHLVHPLPGDVSGFCRDLVRSLDLNYGAIDLILTPEGEYVFLEINPTGQFGWVEALTGLPLIDTLADLLVHGSPAAGTAHAEERRDDRAA